jgi:DNA adenine methylase
MASEAPRSRRRYNSPLRYPGGKAALADFIKSVFRANDLCDGVYAEPYAGGASVALALLFGEYASHVYINDIDPGVYSFWSSVVKETEAICRLVRDTPASVSEWERQRRIYEAGNRSDRLAFGFSAFFLNRTNRSGIIESGGVIGGKRQSSQWGIDARYNQRELAERIERIGRYRDRISVSGLDAMDFLEQARRFLPTRALLYLDPPYYEKGRRRLYANFYGPDDHAAIAESLKAVSWRWLVSYDQVTPIKRLYSGHRSSRYVLRYSAASSPSGSEVMFYSTDLVVPRGATELLKRLSIRRNRVRRSSAVTSSSSIPRRLRQKRSGCRSRPARYGRPRA